MSLVKGFFALYPKIKKCGVRILPESEGAFQCQPVHAGSSAPCSSLAVGHDHVRSGALLLEQRHGGEALADGGEPHASLVVARWPVRRPWRQLTMGLGAWWCRLYLGAVYQLWRLLEKNPVLRGRFVALFALGNLDITFALVVFVLVNGCCLWSTAYGFFGTRALRLWSNFSILHVEVNSNPEASRSVHSRCFWLQFLQRGSHVETWTLFLQVLHFVQFAAVFCCSVQLSP